MKHHILEAVITGERSFTVFASPIKKNKEIDCGYRIAGAKAWGGFNSLAKFDITETPFVNFVRKHSPEIVDSLRNGGERGNLCLDLEYTFKVYFGDKSSKMVIEDKNEELEFFISGDKELNSENSKVRTVRLKGYALETYIRSYCTPSAKKRILN